MEKIIYENNNYFVGENGVYMEMQNIKIINQALFFASMVKII